VDPDEVTFCGTRFWGTLLLILALSRGDALSLAQQSPTPKAPTKAISKVIDPDHPTPTELAKLAQIIDDRLQCTITPLLNGKVLAAGGIPAERSGGFIYPSNHGAYHGHVVFLSSAELYDPITGQSMFTGAMSTGRVDATSALLPNGEVLVAGGENWTGTYSRFALQSAELYDPTIGKFTETGQMNVARQAAVAITLKNGTVLIAAGFGRNVQGLPSGGVVRSEIYDPASGSFKTTGTMTAVRSMYCQGCRPAASILNDGRVLFAGGIDDDGTVLKSAEVYDPVSGTFTRTGDLKAARVSPTATLLPDGKVLIEGGAYHALYGKGSAHPQFIQAVMLKELYDPQTGTFSIKNPSDR
jgi:Galactose oxidase, central domain